MDSTVSVRDIKNKIFDKLKMPLDMQRLVYGRSVLADDRTIEEMAIREGDMMHLVPRLSGG